MNNHLQGHYSLCYFAFNQYWVKLWWYAAGYGDHDDNCTSRLYFSSGVNERAEHMTQFIYLQHNTTQIYEYKAASIELIVNFALKTPYAIL